MIYKFILRHIMQLFTGKHYGLHGPNCGCTKWGHSIALGCPNPTLILKIN